MVVDTSECPSSSCTVRMSCPRSSRCVANECRSVWQVTGLTRRAACAARLTTPPESVGMDVMTPCHTAVRIDRAISRREHELPAPLVAGARVLARQSMRQPDFAVTFSEIAPMKRAHLAKVRLQRLHDIFRQHGDPVLAAFAVAHQDLAIGEIHVLH